MNEQRFRLAKHFIIVSIALIGLIYCLIVLPGSRRFAASSADATRSVSARPDQQLAGTPMTARQDSPRSRSAWADSWIAQNRGRGILLPAVRARAAAAAASFLSPAGPTITAVKSYTLPGAQTTANPGDTITYSIVISNTGMADATGVMFSDMLDANTTFVPGSLNSSPLAINDTYTATGNIAISETAGAGVLANDVDPDTANNTGLTVTQVQGAAGNVGVATNTTAMGIGGVKGSVTLQANGSFTYEPPPGFTGSDTFTYQISDAGGKTDTATVTINITQMVWFINNNAGGSLNRGTFSHPFTTIASFNAVNSGAAPNPQAGDFIALRRGTGTYSEADGINLRDNQKLIGEAVQFSSVFTADAHSIAAYNTFAGGTMTAPTITTTAGNGVDLGSGNTVRGLNVGNTPAFFGFNGGAVGALTIGTVDKTGTGGAISVTTSGTFGSTVNFGTLESTSSASSNINLVSVTGTLAVTSGGTGLSGSAAASAAIVINGGSVTMSYPGAVSKTNTTSLLSVLGGHTGTLTFTGTLNASGGDGLQFNNADGTYNFNGTTTLSGGDAGVDILNGSGGTFSFASTTTITSPSGTAFNVNASSPSVTYSGSITQNTAGQRVINIDTTTSNTITFQTGTITGGASSTGININAANGNVTFSNGMTLGTSGARMTNQAVTIAGGTGTYSLGAVSIFTNNASGIVATNADGTLNCTSASVVDSSGATAININGPAGLTSLGMTLTSVTSAGGTADGISIQNTNGSFTINGDGANTTQGGNSSGGTISGKSGADGSITSGIGIYLNNVTNITLRRITINGTNQNYGIRGLSVNTFTLEYSTVAGTNGTAPTLGAPENNGEGSVYFGNTTTTGMTGTGTVTSCSISGGRGRNFQVTNSSGTLNRLTITGTAFGLNQAFNDANSSLAVEARTGSSPVMNVTVTGSTFTGAPGDLGNFTNQTGTTMDVIFQNNTCSNNHPNNIVGGGGMTFATNGTQTFHVSGNSFRDANGSAITLQKANAGVLLSGFFDNNTIGASGVVDSGSKTGNGIFCSYAGTGTASVTITNNIIRRIHGNGHIFADNTGGSYTANFTIQGNTLDQPGAGEAFAIGMTNGSPGSGDTVNVCAVIGGSTAAQKNTINFNPVQGIVVGSSGQNGGHTFNLPGLGSSTEAAVEAFLLNNNTGAFTTDAYADAPATFAAFTGTGTNCGTPSSGPSGVKTSSLGPTTDQADSGQATSEESVLRAARGEGPYDENLKKLTPAELNWMVQAAIARWAETRIPAEDLARLQAVTFELADLPNSELASLNGNHVKIDETAAGFGWFNDQSPTEDAEFDVPVPGRELHTTQVSPARGKMDLLTVVMHELGKVYLQGKERTPKKLRPLMEPTLLPGVRRMPVFNIPERTTSSLGSADGQSLHGEVFAPTLSEPEMDYSLVPSYLQPAVFNPSTEWLTGSYGASAKRMSYTASAEARNAARARRVAYNAAPTGTTLTVPASGTFTLPPGKSTTVMFQVTVNALNTLPVGTSQVCNQGTVTANGPISVPTNQVCIPLNVADLEVTKSAPATVIAGNTLSYTLTVTNHGPAAATSAMLSDAVPAGTTLASVTTPAGWSRTDAVPAGGTGTITFTKATVANAETATFTIVVNVPGTTAHNTVITNSATVSSSTADTTPANNTATAMTTVTGKADLTLSKSAPATVNAGSDLTYTINFSNAGPGTAVNVVVTDAVPAGTTFVSASVTSGTGWTVNTSGPIVFSKASVPSGETATFQIVVNVPAATAGGTIIHNSVSATADTNDPTPATATADTTVIAQADLALTKTGSPTPDVIAGNNITYTIGLTNNGPAAATSVTVSDPTPANTTLVSVTTPAGWTRTDSVAPGLTGTITFTKATVANAETATFTIVVKVNSSTANGATITNTATVTSTTTDPVSGNNMATAMTNVIRQIDLAVTKSDSPDPVIAGNVITYTINFSNNGPSDASNVTVTDAVPANTTFLSAMVTTGSGWSTNTAGPIVFSKAAVGAGESAVFTITVKVNSDTANGATINNSVTAAATETDTNSSNNTATASTSVITRADLVVLKSDSPDPVSAGTNLTYTINFNNAGPSDAQTVTVSDAVPAGTSLVSATVTTGTGWAVNTAGPIVFSKATVAAGESAVFTIVVSVPASTASGTVISNSATASSATTDPTPGNNTGTAMTTVQTSADLAVTKSDTPDPSFAGANITYTIGLTNNGPSDAQSVTMSDPTPTNTTLVSVTTPAGWSRTDAVPAGGTGTITFTKATVAASETATFTIVVKVDAATPTGTTITNTATASSTTTDPTPGNNSATATTSIQAQADLAITKTASPTPTVIAGNQITYTINLINNGPGAATSVSVTDPTPTNTTLVSVTTPAGWSRTDAVPAGGTGTITFTKATVANAETATFTIVVKVNSSTANGATITNTATVTSTTGDPTPGNNMDVAMTNVIRRIDLAVTKSDAPDPVIAGNNITYTINFVNNGPSDASTVTVTDTLPAGTGLVSAVVTTGVGWATTTPAGQVVFSKATVTAGETAVFTIVVSVPASTANGATINNSVTAAATETDTDNSNNTATASTSVITRADLVVLKSDSPDPVSAGANLTYTINFSNAGPSDAQTVTVSDAVPAGTSLVSATVTTGTGWAVNTAGPIVFSKATVAAGESAVFTIVVSVPASTASGTVISNSATASSATTDPTPGNNTGTAMTTVQTSADLAVTKSDSPDPVSAGSNITYTINFVNNGPSDAQTVTVTDAVPANTTFVSATVTTGSGWSTNTAGPIVFSKGTVAAGETAVFTMVVKVNSNVASGTVISNSATAASTTTDPTPGNNTGTATTTVQVMADLAITKTDSPDPVIAGNNITYTINLTNNGPSDASTVSVSDAVPANTTFVSAMVISGSGWAVNTAGPIVFSKATVINGETATFQIIVKVNANVASGTTISNTASVTATSSDGTPANNSATATTTVQTQADLAVTKSDSPDPVTAGNNLTYTINFVNNGPSDAQTVTVTDAVPANTTFVSAVVTTGVGWAVNTAGPIVFSKGTVAAGETAVFTMVVKVNANAVNGSTISNSATASSATTDPTPGNNTGSATTTVQTRADLAVTKSDSPDPVNAGANLTYTINFVNNGPSDAQTVTVTDAVPANTTFVSATVTTGSGWSTNTAGPVVFSKGTVAAGETAVFTMVVKVNSNVASGTVISNSATAASTTTDPTPGNNTGTATTTVQVQADLAVTKSDSPDPVVASQNLTYTINFVNNGPSDAQTVTVTDAVPANTTFVSATVTTGSGWGKTQPAVGASSGNVQFSKATVTAGETAVFTIVVNVNAGTANNTIITNSATAAATTPDPNSGNNTGTATTTVIAQADLAVTKSDSPDPVCVNGNITYTINFINNGPGPGLNTTVSDAVPANTTFVSATVTTGSGWSVNTSGPIVFSKANVAAGETAVFTMVVKVNAGTLHGTVISNTVTAMSSIPDPTPGNNSATTTTTVDPIPPVITCPANITAVAPLTCPASNTATVTFAPTVTDNCAATVMCVPPSGSAFPTGTTTVTCTATDTAGNTASCSFTVTVWTGCLQDDTNPGNVVLFDAQTGKYQFCCNGQVVATGTGTVKVAGCTVTINHLKQERRVQLSAEMSAKRGTATIIISNETTCQITDRNMLNNTCLCPAP
jgi:uncharacterized repeat protein (TIGR01451 family)